MSPKQLGLFGPTSAGAGAVSCVITDQDREIAARLPAFVRFGTSSWTFPGWPLWAGSPTADALAKEGLRAYAAHPLLRTVGIDRSYYGPLRDEDLEGYAGQLAGAPAFRAVSKVWEELTTAVFPRHPRYGARAGTPNPHFLDPERFLSEVVAPYRRSFGAHAGPFVFELTPMPRGAMDAATLAARVDALLARVRCEDEDLRLAFELRNEELFGARWLDALRAHAAAHVFTYWTAMPSIRAQLAPRGVAAGAPFVVARLMLPRYARYAEKKAEYAPFDRLVSVQPEMRDDVLALLRASADAGASDAYVIVNNKAEGSAFLTIRALADRTARELG